MIDDAVMASALDALERAEADVLAWGILDRGLERRELEEFLASEVDPLVADPRDVLKELLARKLLFDVPHSSPPVYRSRMAEGVRLFASLRQQFPNRPWTTSPRLVADHRFLVRPRAFPQRNMPADELEQHLAAAGLSGAQRRALRALVGVGPTDPPRKVARFQAEATEAILRSLGSGRDEAHIVTAGTGSGKTLAFYLPTLLHLVADPQVGKGVRVLAVYPRKELLKDQFRATLREVRRLRRVEANLPRVRVGAYFGLTPMGGKLPIFDYLGWERHPSPAGHVCPYLTCPGVTADDCGGELLWTDADRNGGRERLVCARCEGVVDQDEVVLSRQAMGKKPPDIVFTTTEMLNLSLHNGWARNVICGERDVRPQMVLIDEAHTYFGATGAQNAYVLRRWRHAIGRPVTWVGLSATLRDAEQFFSALTGVPAHAVREITPAPEDVERRGHEYQLLLRGDPTSQAALLSTSIQSLMLLVRLLDPLDDRPSAGAYGSKVFAFCDKLDLTNRLHQQLLDAEGRTKWGKQVKPSLAELRSARAHPDRDDWDLRDRDGQAWWAVDSLRGETGPPVVGRTSSQDGGVQARAEVVVATAALEVGYDDPDVGAVLQHKAPRDLAQFVQRRGRAGRSREMRPWTIVVLSDFGRDRLAYQSYEQLLDPLLPPRSLPLGNRSIRRMQATFALMDWASTRLLERDQSRRSSVGKALAGPAETDADRAFQRALADLLTSVLDDERVRADAVAHIGRALGLSRQDLDIVLWDGPRSVLLEAVPTAVRRLRSGWARVVDGHVVSAADTIRRGHPLPEMLPANLFSDLALPEVAIVSPDGYDEAADAEEPAFLALREMAPGNVTLRYAVKDKRGLWIDPGAADGVLDVETSMLQGAWPIAELTSGNGEPIEVMRPVSLRPEVTGPAVGMSSSGRLDWRLHVTPEMEAIEATLPDGSPWAPVVMSMDVYVQARRGGVRMLRYAESGEAVVTRQPGGRERLQYRLGRGGAPVAIGVELDVDAVRITIRPPEGLGEAVASGSPARLRRLRSDRFAADAAERLAPLGIDRFLARWLSEISVAAVAHETCLGGGAPPADWSRSDWQVRLLTAFDRAFVSPTVDVDEPSDAALRDQVVAALSVPGVTEGLAAAHEAAVADPRPSWEPWLRRRFSVTVAAAVHSAVQTLLPEFDAESDLAIDLVDGAEGTVEVWLTETTTGGGGIVESLHAAYGEDPRRFWSLAATALEPSDIEDAAAGLHHVVALLDGPLATEVAATRKAACVRDTVAAWRDLLKAISRRGIAPTHALSTTLATRIVRAGSSAESDAAALLSLERWAVWDEQVGLALDERTACSLLATQDDIVAALRRAAPSVPAGPTAAWAAQVLLSVLWASPETVRPASLVAPMPFTDDVPPSERTLVLDALDDAAPEVHVDDTGWRGAADAALARQGRCRLVAPSGSPLALRDALVDLAAHPVEVGALHLHPRLVGIRRGAALTSADMVLDEAPQ